MRYINRKSRSAASLLEQMRKAAKKQTLRYSFRFAISSAGARVNLFALSLLYLNNRCSCCPRGLAANRAADDDARAHAAATLDVDCYFYIFCSTDGVAAAGCNLHDLNWPRPKSAIIWQL